MNTHSYMVGGEGFEPSTPLNPPSATTVHSGFDDDDLASSPELAPIGAPTAPTDGVGPCDSSAAALTAQERFDRFRLAQPLSFLDTLRVATGHQPMDDRERRYAIALGTRLLERGYSGFALGLAVRGLGVIYGRCGDRSCPPTVDMCWGSEKAVCDMAGAAYG